MKNNKLFKNIFIGISLVFTSIAPSYSNEKSITLDIQSLILLKTISYDRTIQGNEVNIAVIFDPANSNSINSKDQIIDNIKVLKQGIKNKVIKVNPVSFNSISSSKSADIYYLTKDLPSSSSISQASRNNKIITWSVDSSDVRQGNASISVINKNNRPKLLINIRTLRSEGHDLSSQLLKLSEIID